MADEAPDRQTIVNRLRQLRLTERDVYQLGAVVSDSWPTSDSTFDSTAFDWQTWSTRVRRAFRSVQVDDLSSNQTHNIDSSTPAPPAAPTQSNSGQGGTRQSRPLSRDGSQSGPSSTPLAGSKRIHSSGSESADKLASEKSSSLRKRSRHDLPRNDLAHQGSHDKANTDPANYGSAGNLGSPMSKEQRSKLQASSTQSPMPASTDQISKPPAPKFGIAEQTSKEGAASASATSSLNNNSEIAAAKAGAPKSKKIASVKPSVEPSIKPIVNPDEKPDMKPASKPAITPNGLLPAPVATSKPDDDVEMPDAGTIEKGKPSNTTTTGDLTVEETSKTIKTIRDQGARKAVRHPSAPQRDPHLSASTPPLPHSTKPPVKKSCARNIDKEVKEILGLSSKDKTNCRGKITDKVKENCVDDGEITARLPARDDGLLQPGGAPTNGPVLPTPTDLPETPDQSQDTQPENICDLIAPHLAVIDPHFPSYKKQTIVIQGIELLANRERHNVLEIASKILDDAYTMASRIIERPHSVPNDELTFGNVHEVLLGNANFHSPFTGKSFQHQHELIKAFLASNVEHRLTMNLVESYYWDTIQQEIQSVLPFANTPASEASMIQQFHTNVLGDKKQLERSSTSAWRNLWKTLSQLRQSNCFFLLAYRNPTLNNMIKRKEISLQELQRWDGVLNTFYTRWCLDTMAMQYSGDYRGLNHIPNSIRSPELEARWSSHLGRWRSVEDAITFSHMYGAPIPCENHLATELCIHHGFMGYSHLNGHSLVAIVQLHGESRWTCITTGPVQAGTVLGISPHVMSLPEESATKGHHIHGRFQNVDYDPLEVVGRLSFVRYVKSERYANAKLGSDIHCDPLLPNYYSVRVWVVATQNIGPFEAIKVRFVENEALGSTAEETNGRFQEILKPVRGVNEVARKDSFAFQFDELASSLCIDGEIHREEKRRLTETYWIPNLAKAARAVIAVSHDDGLLLHRWAKITGRIDFDGLPFIQAYKKQYHAHRAVSAARPIDVLQDMTLVAYAFTASKATFLYPRIKYSSKESEAIREATSKGTRAVKHFQIEDAKLYLRPLAVPPGRGHLAVALQMIYAIEPLRLILMDTWEFNWAVEQWNPPAYAKSIPDVDIDSLRIVYDSFLQSLSRVMTAMSESPRMTPVSEPILQHLGDQLDRVLDIRTQDPMQLDKAQDAHEVYTYIHGILLDTLRGNSFAVLRSNPAIQRPHLTRSSQKAQLSEAAASAWRLFQHQSSFPILVNITIGQLHERYHCQGEGCAAMIPASRDGFAAASQLTLPLPGCDTDPISLHDLIRTVYGSQPSRNSIVDPPQGTPARCSLGAHPLALRPSCELVIPPEYLLIQLVRFRHASEPGTSKEAKFVKSKKQVLLPNNLIVDLNPIMLPLDLKTSNRSARYEIVLSVEHKGDTLEDGHYVCLAKSDGAWVHLNRASAWIAKAVDVKSWESDVYLLLLKRLDSGEGVENVEGAR